MRLQHSADTAGDVLVERTEKIRVNLPDDHQTESTSQLFLRHTQSGHINCDWSSHFLHFAHRLHNSFLCDLDNAGTAAKILSQAVVRVLVVLVCRQRNTSTTASSVNIRSSDVVALQYIVRQYRLDEHIRQIASPTRRRIA